MSSSASMLPANLLPLATLSTALSVSEVIDVEPRAMSMVFVPANVPVCGERVGRKNTALYTPNVAVSVSMTVLTIR